MTTPATITTEELDALAALRTDAHNQCAANPFSRDAHTAVTKYHAAIVGDGERLIEQARRGAMTESAWANAHDERYKQMEDAVEERDAFESQIGTIVGDIGLECEWSNLHDHSECVQEAFEEMKSRAESAESDLAAARERLEIAVEALKAARAGLHSVCVFEATEREDESLIGEIEIHHNTECKAATAALSAIAAKAGTGGKGEGEK